MSDLPLNRTSSTSSSISPFSLQPSPRIESVGKVNLPRRSESSPPLRNRKHKDINAPEDSSALEDRPRDWDIEPQSVLISDWIRMKIEEPKVFFGVLYMNMFASLFTWLILAYIMISPVTFSSARNSRALDSLGNGGKAVLNAVQNVPFVWLAGSCFVCGLAGLLWVWWENRNNYIWLMDRIFL